MKSIFHENRNKNSAARLLCRMVGATLICLFVVSPSAADNRALLVGVGAYELDDALPGIDKDLQQMREVALMMGFTDGQIKTLMDGEATLAGIESAFERWLIRGTGPGDRALFYFSGHGSQVDDENGDEADGVDEVLAPYDIRTEKRRLINAFIDDDFGRLLSRVRAREILVFIDACHSGTPTKGLSLLEEKPKFLFYEGMPGASAKANFAVREVDESDRCVALSAARDDQLAFATSDGSLFTRGLHHAVENAIWNEDRLSLEAARQTATNYISAHVSHESLMHHPQLTGNRDLAHIDLIRVRPRNLWKRFQFLVEKSGYPVDVRVNKTRFRVGEELVISCDVKSNGYLNVISLDRKREDAVVLYPNRHHPDNFVEAGSTISIPAVGDKFKLTATPPAGSSMVVVLHTEKNLNAYRDGIGKTTDLFRRMSGESMRNFEVREADGSSRYGAARVLTEIVE